MYFTRFAFAQFVLWIQRFVVDAYFAFLLFDMIFTIRNITGYVYAKKILWFFFLPCLIYEFFFFKCPHCKKRLPFSVFKQKDFHCPHCDCDQF